MSYNILVEKGVFTNLFFQKFSYNFLLEKAEKAEKAENFDPFLKILK